ncbi:MULTISPECIES: DoxX family protein [unclassified Methylophilus]|uniref:DoxX family protein n=1 Tax=unclassified Methylophilus TaxID=2630143 RepID=UPI00188E3D8A|nr:MULTISPECIES: DoxX family protein [unclassified Methylophilus]MBF5040667.1 DoxX family protein [Methylophilus sp. 13]MDF0377902.1 DoxX family membrane protein [Methylophilus sp. YYY-1]MDT7849264.1 DoxX family protein [Methylophilus sp. VKM B-3414]
MNVRQRWISLLGRVLLSLVFIVSGVGKVLDPAGTLAYIESAHLPMPQLAYAVALVVELGLGLALLLGFRAQLAAAGIALFTFVTALVFHSNMADPLQVIMFLKNMTIVGGLLIVIAFGPGGYSVDGGKRIMLPQ